jgi:DNA-binding CsgD family transcriptional regulator
MDDLIEFFLNLPKPEPITVEELEERRRKSWEHYQRLFIETRHCLYYVHSRGYITKYMKKDLTENGPLANKFVKVPMKIYKRDKKNKHEIFLAVVINHRRYSVKNLVARTFSRIWEPGSKIYHRNKKLHDCNFKNLLIVPPHVDFEHTHRGKAILVLINKHWVRFESLKEAADELNVSISSFRRHIKGKLKNKSKSSLHKIKFKYVE